MSEPRLPSDVDALDIDDLARELDRFGMAGVIERTGGQIAHAVRDPEVPEIEVGPIDRVVVAGMGGSALPVDVLLGGLGPSIHVPVTVCRHYRELDPVDDRTLVIASSFSGNTEETLEALDGLVSAGARPAVVSAGGRLAELADQRGWPLARIPAEREGDGFQPRCATGYVVTYVARLLAAAGCMDDPAEELAALPGFLGSLDARTPALEMARWLGQRVAVIYTEERHARSVARVTKIKINEHAKRAAFWNALPEANHNEMIGFVSPVAPFGLIYLKDPSGHPRVHRRFEVMREVFADEGLDHVSFAEWELPGRSALERIFAALAFGDWMAWALALLDGRDPTPVDLVERFKTEMR